MSDEPVLALPRPPKFFCEVHGATNQVQGLDAETYCLPCLCRVATNHLQPIHRLADIAR